MCSKCEYGVGPKQVEFYDTELKSEHPSHYSYQRYEQPVEDFTACFTHTVHNESTLKQYQQYYRGRKWSKQICCHGVYATTFIHTVERLWEQLVLTLIKQNVCLMKDTNVTRRSALENRRKLYPPERKLTKANQPSLNLGGAQG